MSDSVPLLVFTGQVNRAGIGKDAFQESGYRGNYHAHHQVQLSST